MFTFHISSKHSTILSKNTENSNHLQVKCLLGLISPVFLLITYSSTHILRTCLCEIIFYYHWIHFSICVIFSPQNVKTPAIWWGRWIKTDSISLLVTDTIYPLGKLFIPGKARWKDYGNVNGNKEAKCLVTTRKCSLRWVLKWNISLLWLHLWLAFSWPTRYFAKLTQQREQR